MLVVVLFPKRVGFSLLMKFSWKTFVLEVVSTFVLEVWIRTFGESLVENARFGSVDSQFC